jgi:hypothetical protein
MRKNRVGKGLAVISDVIIKLSVCEHQVDLLFDLGADPRRIGAL